MPSPNYTLTGTNQTIGGSADVGYVLITLNGYGVAVPKVTGTSLIANQQYKAVCNGSGQWSAVVWGRDQLTPSATTYSVQMVSSNGAKSTPKSYVLTGGGSHDITTLTPL